MVPLCICAQPRKFRRFSRGIQYIINTLTDGNNPGEKIRAERIVNIFKSLYTLEINEEREEIHFKIRTVFGQGLDYIDDDDDGGAGPVSPRARARTKCA